MKPLPLLSLRSFTFLTTDYSVSLMIMEKKTNDFGEGNGFSSHAFATGFSRSFYINTTHKGTHWIRKPDKGWPVKISKY